MPIKKCYVIWCKVSYLIMALNQSAENRRKECHRFWLRLHHAVILISNDRTSASKKINGMALILTLKVSTSAFKRMKKTFYGFWQTEFEKDRCKGAEAKELNNRKNYFAGPLWGFPKPETTYCISLNKRLGCLSKISKF